MIIGLRDPSRRLPFAGLPMSPFPGKIYRGSPRHLRRIRWRGNGSREMGLMIVWVVFLIGVLVWWITGH